MIKNKNSSAGITLIALVVTIIVLLILAEVAVSMIKGNNGILQRTGRIKDAAGRVQTEEEMEIAAGGAAAKTLGAIKYNDLNTELEKVFGNDYSIEETGDSELYHVTAKGINFTISAVGDVETVEVGDTPAVTPGGDFAGLSSASGDATLPNGVSEVTFAQIDANTNLTSERKTALKDTTKIKAVIKGTGTNNEDEVPIPIGATYKEGTESTGIVIVYKESEFVWVPVKDAVYDATRDGELPKSTTKGSLQTGYTYTPMAINVGTSAEPDYRGLLYDGFSTTYGSYLKYNSATNNPNYQGASTKYKEPDIVSTNDAESKNYLKDIGFTKTVNNTEKSDPNAFLLEMKTYYKNMVESVTKYGGFYVGRYETSLNSTTTVASQKSPVSTGTGVILPMSAEANSGNMWYGMYDKQKKFSGKNANGADNSDTMVSSMIWGSQYDAMLNWMLTGTDMEKIGEVANGNHNETEAIGCGTSANDKINNIYDLEGNVSEFILEAFNTYGRAYRRR